MRRTLAETHVGLMYGSRYYRRIVTQSDMYWHVLVNVPNIKFNENQFRSLSHKDRQARRMEANGPKTD
jgi:hypothetical protein